MVLRRSEHPRAEDDADLWVPEGDGQLVGREGDIRDVTARLGGLGRVTGSLLLLGEPGVGKTALLAAVISRVRRSGVQVVSAAGAEYRSDVSYGALRQLMNSAVDRDRAPVLEGELAVVMGRKEGLPPDHTAVADAVVTVVRQLARTAPTLLVVDDVQWLDPASAVVLSQVARRLAGTGAALLCTARQGSEGFFELGGLPCQEVRPLDDPASEELLVRCFPALAPRVRRRLMAEAQGNPLALLELPVELTGRQQAAAEPLPERLALGRRLQSAFASRVTSLPAPTRYLLLLAALDGSGDLQVVSRAVAGQCGLKHLQPAERAGLVRVDERPSLHFRHPLTQSAVVELTTSDQRRSAHRALARAWAGTPERQAWHLAHAAVGPDEDVAVLLERAAAVIRRRGDGPAAVAALVRAAELSPDGQGRARRLAEAAYTGANITGDLRDVPRLLDDARRAAPGESSVAAAAAGAAYLLNDSGDIDTAHSLLRGAVTVRPGPNDPDDTLLVEAFHTWLLVCFFGGRADLWEDYDAAADFTVEPPLLAITRGTFVDPARATPRDLARLDDAVESLAHETDPLRIVRVATAGAYVDRLGGCAEGLRRVVAGGREGENVTPAIEALFLLGNHAWLTGQWSELHRFAADGLRLCDRYHYPMLAWVGKFLLACAAAASGDHTTARDLTDQMDQWAGPRRADAVRAYAAHAKALSALGRGDFEAAYLHATGIAPAGTFPRYAPHTLWTVMDLVDAAVRTGRRQEALAHVAAAQDAGLQHISPRMRMLVHASAALASESDEHPGFREALSVPEAERWPFDQARIHLSYGERLRRGKASAQAQRHLGAATEIFERLGAAPWADRARQELRASGRPGNAAPGSDVGLLTPQQSTIANLAAAGLSNKQIAERLFLSPRTVSTHLHQLFPKLGVTSRAALRDALQELHRA